MGIDGSSSLDRLMWRFSEVDGKSFWLSLSVLPGHILRIGVLFSWLQNLPRVGEEKKLEQEEGGQGLKFAVVF